MSASALTTRAVVVFDRVSKHYGPRPALRDVSLAIAPGEVFGLLGPNGSGKSTLLKLLTGLLVPTAGRIEIEGMDIATHGRLARRHLGYVPEDAPLYPQMRVAEFLAFMARLKQVPRPAVAGAVERVSTMLGLTGVMSLVIGKLSHGFRQRVLIAQALLNDPALLILDEPTNGLDPQQIIELRELVQGLASRHTILLTTHILSEVEKVATRVGILLRGQLRADLAVNPADRVILRAIPPAGTALADVLGAVPDLVVLRALPTEAPAAGFELQLVQSTARIALAQALQRAACAVLELQPAPSALEAHFLTLTADPP